MLPVASVGKRVTGVKRRKAADWLSVEGDKPSSAGNYVNTVKRGNRYKVRESQLRFCWYWFVPDLLKVNFTYL